MWMLSLYLHINKKPDDDDDDDDDDDFTEVLNLLKVSILLMSEGNEFQSLMPLKKKVVEACLDICSDKILRTPLSAVYINT